MSTHPIRILSLDGGGIRGLSSLVVLQELMRQIARDEETETGKRPSPDPRPCEHFDLICGTSTGGLIALMLGRLKLPVDDAISHYTRLSEKVFKSKSRSPKATFDHEVLEREIKNIIATAVPGGQSPSVQLKDIRPDLCRTFVVASPLDADGPVRMRSYGTRHHNPFPACIWQAARATAAAPTYFLPMEIDNVIYGDGGTGWNNPTKQAIAEARNMNRPIGILVSIGTGREEVLQLKDTSKEIPSIVQTLLRNTAPQYAFRLVVAEYAVKCLTRCERVHQEVSEHCDEVLNGNYFRLNVEKGMAGVGLDEWDKLGEIKALARSYMEEGDRKRAKWKIAELLRHPEKILSS